MKMRWLLILLLFRPLAAQQPQRVVDVPFIAIESAQFASVALDVESTQRCIREGTCHESNILMGQSRTQEYAVSMGDAALMTVVAYELKKHGVKKWWLVPTVEIGVHTGLAAWNFHF